MIKIIFSRCIPFILFWLPVQLSSQDCVQALDSLRSVLSDNVQEAITGYTSLTFDSLNCPFTYLQVRSDLAFLAYQQTNYQEAYEWSEVFSRQGVDPNLLIEHCFYGIWAEEHEAIKHIIRHQMDPRFDFIRGMLLWNAKGTNADSVEVYLAKAFAVMDSFSDRLQYELTIWRAQNLMHSQDRAEILQARDLLLGLLLRVQAENQPIAEVWIHYQLGYWARINGDAIAYADQFEQSLRINDRINLWPKDHPFRYRILNALALGLESIGDLPSAYQYMSQTIQFFANRNDDLTVAKRQLNLAKILRKMDRSDEAINLYQKVIPIFEKYGELENLYSTHNNLGNIYTDLGEYDAALQHAQRALQLKISVVGHMHEHTAISYLNLGQTYLTFSKFSQAEKSLKHAREIFNQLEVNKAGLQADVYLNLGFMYQRQNFWTMAEDAFIKSIRILEMPENHLQSNDRETNVRYINSPLDYIQAQSALAGLYSTSDSPLYNFDKADSLYQLSFDHLEQIRYRYDNPEAKQELQKKATRLYEDMVQLLCSADANAYRLYSVIERAKSYQLRVHLNNQTLSQQFSIPPQLTEIDEKLETTIDQVVAQLYQQSTLSEAQRDSLHSVIDSLKEESRLFQQKLRKDYPEYYFEKYQSAVPNLADLQSRLKENEVVLSFYELPSQLICLIITQGSAEVWVDSLPPDFPVRCQDFIKSITGADRSFTTLIDQLSASPFRFMASILETIPEGSSLIIVPHQDLSIIPIEILLTETPDEIFSFRQIPYVIQKYGVRYSYSASIIDNSQAPSNKGNYLGVAPVCYPENLPDSEYKVLAYSKQEVENSAKDWPSKVLLGPEATKQNLLANLDQFNIYHFATHAIIDPYRPLYGSKLILSDDPGLMASNLYIHELYHLNLPGQLAVLSACNTGVGQFESGEGQLSLARAFRYAGCPNLLYSKWSVDDQATGNIMEKFFDEVKSGSAISVALQEAKRKYLSNVPVESEYRLHPYYWAGFVITGDYVFKPNYWHSGSWVLGLAFLVLIAFIFGFLYRRRRRAT